MPESLFETANTVVAEALRGCGLLKQYLVEKKILDVLWSVPSEQ